MTSPSPNHAVPGLHAAPPVVRWARIMAGILIVAVGVGWLLDGLGVAMPWHALPPAGLVIVGLTLAVSGRARGSLVGLGAILMLVSLLAVLPVRVYAGPVGDRTVAPSASGWPVERALGAGTLRVDLTRQVLPSGGRVSVRVGVGNLRLFVPSGVSVRFVCAVAVGDIRVDGVTVDDGFGAGWSRDSADPDTILVDARVGVGSLDVRHG